ncbi:MAG TPA: HAMP domain-containing sensor histidine kinase, partial [Deinococcales bacterium]|nr:HAMP domain-containing sensor histidine kinase [Deinococcales bacterium]
RAQRRELKRRHAVIRDLVYAFSHDLRTPLLANALVMRLAVQGAYGPLSDALRGSLENGLSANQDLLDLADKLLVVARLEGGEGLPDVARLDLAEVVRQRARDLEPRLAERSLALDLRLEPAPVRGSATDLRRVAQNLLDNAIKFSPPGGTIVARVAREDGQAVLSVTDSGPGVPEDLRPRLFQRFRGGGAGAGSGLGLYLARSIVQAHGGRIAYRREAGRSVFEASLPLDAPEEAAPARELEGAAR